MDFLNYLQKKAAAGSGPGGITGPGTPGYVAAKLGSFAPNVDYAPPPPPEPTDEGGGFWDALNPSEYGINLGAIGSAAVDILSRPSYAVNNMLQEQARNAGELADDGFQFSDIAQLTKGFSPGQAWQGLSGQQKVLGADVIDTSAETLGKNPDEINPWVKGIAGLGIDIFADPTTYIGAGVVKDVIKGVKGTKDIAEVAGTASKTTEEMAQELSQKAVRDQFDFEQAGVKTGKARPAAESHIDQLRKISEDFNTVEPTVLKETPKVAEDIPKVAIEAPKIVPDTLHLSTEDVPWAKAQITDRTKGMLQKVADFSQMPVPTGSKLTVLEGGWAQPGSTNAYMRAGAHAVNNAEEVIFKSERFHDIHAANAKDTAKLTEAYRAGAIRPPINTPAEQAFMDAVGTHDLRDVAKDPLAKLDFFAVPDEFRATMLHLSRATIFGGENGKTAKSMSANKLWDVLHGAPTNIDTSKIFIRKASGGKVSLKEVIEKNKEALADPEFWRQGAKISSMIQKDPSGFAERIMKQNIAHLRQSERMVYDDFADWASKVKEMFPSLSENTIKAAHDAADKLLKDIWQNTVVNNPRGNVQKFMAAQRASTQIRDAMTEAIARNAPPEELVTDIATIRHSFTMAQLDADLQKILNSSISPEAKVTAANATEATAQQADETLKATEEVAMHADEARATEAQAKESNSAVATAARETANFNEIAPGAQRELDKGTWGSSLTKDQAIGIVRGAVAKTLKTMMKLKNHASFNQFNQTNVLNRILSEIGRGSSEDIKAVVRLRGNAKSLKNDKVVTLAHRVWKIMDASEHQMDEAAGFMPSVWNSGSGVSRGWRIGTPGVVNTVKDADRANVPFSSAHLMDDMIQADFRKVAEGKESDSLLPKALFGGAAKKSPLWTKVVEAAIFKNKDALDEIPDATLRKWLLDYDPSTNMSMASERYSGKIQSYVEAQSSAAERHLADVKANDSPARSAMEEAKAKSVAKETIQRDPAAPVEDAEAIADSAKAASDDLSDAITGPVNSTARSIEEYKNVLGEVRHTSPNMSKANNAARQTSKEAGAEPLKEFKAMTGPEFEKSFLTKVKELFQTQAGAETLRPLMQNSFDYIKSATAEMARTWKRYDNDLMKAVRGDNNAALQAIKSLDSSAGYVVPAGAEDIVRGMRTRMEKALGGSDLTRFVAGNSSVMKGAIPRDAVNDWLKAKGSKFYFEDGEDWMSQWEKSIANAKTPQEALHQLHQIESAVLHSTVERTFFDELAARFGSKSGGYSVPHKYLSGVGFESKDMAMEAKRITELVEQLQKPQSASRILRMYDQALRLWKTGMTIYNPAHHIKNFTGDYWLYMGDGGTIMDFKNSCKMLNKYKGKSFDPEAGVDISNKLKDITDPAKLLERIMKPKSNDVAVKIKSSGMTLTDDQIMAGAELHAMFHSAGVSEDIIEAGNKSLFGEKVGGALTKENRLGMSLAKPAAGKIHRGASVLSETRDHSVRLAHFLHAIRNTTVKKTAKMTDEQYIKLVMEDAARRARTHHPDGLDLTAAERKYARRLIPFYSWQRKSIPVILQTAWKRPGLVTAYPKAQTAVTIGATGENPTEGFGSLPGDQMFPSWIQDNPWAVVGGEAAGIGTGEQGYELAKGPSVPSNDLVPMLNDPRSMLSQLTPFGRVPLEMYKGEEMGTGIPIQGAGGQATYAAKQVPGISKIVQGATNANSNSNDLLNWMSGMGLLDSGKYTGSAWWEQQNARK